jgi:hypothetical protein
MARLGGTFRSLYVAAGFILNTGYAHAAPKEPCIPPPGLDLRQRLARVPVLACDSTGAWPQPGDFTLKLPFDVALPAGVSYTIANT